MKHILVPIGSRKNASNTLQYAIDLAKEVHAKVYVFRAYKALSKTGTLINMNAILERETQFIFKGDDSIYRHKKCRCKNDIRQRRNN